MAKAETLGYSKTRVDRAGERLRKWLIGEVDLTEDTLQEELVVVDAFRSCHAAPLQRVAAGIRYYVDRHSSVKTHGRSVVGQRLKRMRTIADKLLRHPDMRLSQMHDIGGCRALFQSADEMQSLVADLERQKRWEIYRVRNYVEHPKERSGYRAVHVVVRKDGFLSSASSGPFRSMPGQR